MKRYFVIVFLCAALLSQAQHKPFQFGIKAGGNLGWFGTHTEGYASVGSHPGGSWGLLADIFLMENYSITSGFDVLYLNGKLTYPHIYRPDNGGSTHEGELERRYATTYIELPILLTMKTNEIGKFRYFGQLGVGLGVLLSAKSEDVFTSRFGIPFEKTKENIYDEMAFYRTSFILGGGLEIPLHKSTCIRTGFKYDNCFLNVLRDKNTLYPERDNQAVNHFFELYAAIIF